MSQDFMDPELFADFIVEAREHLETIEPNLLELERNPGNLSLLNDIFRPMHSLKGASGFLGLNAINGLAHKAENILDELRKGNIPVNPEIMDVILAATDLLRTMIENLEQTGGEGDVDTAPVIARIAAQLEGGAAALTPPPAPAGAGDFPAEDAPPAVSEAPAAPAHNSSAPEEPEASEPAGPSAASLAAAKIAKIFEELPPFAPEAYPLTSIGEGHMADFLEEAREIIERLNAALLELESAGDGRSESINDIFRYFHNLKGNSGIIGHKELNSLTHEAETLLNRVRKGEITATRAMVDLLLAVVDQVEALVSHIEPATSVATPQDIRPLVARLKQATEDGEVLEPEPEPQATPEPEAEAAAEPEPEPEPEPAPEPEPKAAGQEAKAGSGYDPEDVAVFESTIDQQMVYMTQALAGLAENPESKDMVDGLYRALVTIQNSSGYMGLAELKVQAERTAGIVAQARKQGLSFELLLDMLRQECSILGDMLTAAMGSLRSGKAKAPAAASLPEAPKAVAPEPAPAPQPEPKPEPKPEPAPKAAPAPKPEAKPAPAPAPKPVPKPEAKAAPKPAPAPAPEAAADAGKP